MSTPLRIGERIEQLGYASRLAIGTLILVSGAAADFSIGPQYTVLLLYLAAVTFAAWFVGARFALFVSGACAISGFLAALPWGGSLGSTPLAYWNVTIRLLSYLLVTWLALENRTYFDRIRKQAADDALALREEQSFSGSLQDELEVREAEQHRIGRDLHDGLSQHLTATMLASKILEERLAERALEEAAAAEQLTSRLAEALGQLQDLARGLHSADLVAAGLPGALGRLATTTQQLSQVPCEFTATDGDVALDESMSTHLFRIAQEALNNSVRHGRPSHIVIGLAIRGDSLELAVADDGIGIPEAVSPSGGLGLRTMQERARAIGGRLEVGRRPGGGTRVTCTVEGVRIQPAVNGSAAAAFMPAGNGSGHAPDRGDVQP